MERFGDANLKKISKPGVRIASGVTMGRQGIWLARSVIILGSHYFMVSIEQKRKYERKNVFSMYGNVQYTGMD